MVIRGVRASDVIENELEAAAAWSKAKRVHLRGLAYAHASLTYDEHEAKLWVEATICGRLWLQV